MSDQHFPMAVSIVVHSQAQLTSVYALLGGVAAAAIVSKSVETPKASAALQVTEDHSDGTKTHGQESLAQHGHGLTATTDASPSDPDRPAMDADGHPFNSKLHTGSITKAGLWRMKAGTSRPAPMEGFPKETGVIGTAAVSTAPQPSTIAVSEPVGAIEEDDEFAAFREASAKSDAAKAAVKVPARKWTDADLGALCNQAASKLGDPTPIKEVISMFVPSDQVPHSRNVPAENREAFALALEAKAGITFAG